MKIKVKAKPYEEVCQITPAKPGQPAPQSFLLRSLIRLLSAADTKKLGVTYEIGDRKGIPEGTPCLYLMNHSCFLDLEIASCLIGAHPFHIVCTSDGLVGKEWLMRKVGCIPTQKFVTDLKLVKDMMYCLNELHSSVLMYPEASYSFDGTATALPAGLAKFVKMMKVPVMMIRTHGAFLRDPLYNGLQIRKVPISAQMYCLFTPSELEEKSAAEIAEALDQAFTFDHFREQQERRICVKEPFRADGLQRVLFRCPKCGREGSLVGKGIELTCNCGYKVELDEYGFLKGEHPDPRFAHIPSWYAWERECIAKEVAQEDYKVEIPVRILMMVDTSAVYEVGEGTLTHSREGFRLTGCKGKLDYRQKPKASYSLYADYFWYEIGDMVCIGDRSVLYYCFPKEPTFPVARMRLAAEELYRIVTGKKEKKA